MSKFWNVKFKDQTKQIKFTLNQLNLDKFREKIREKFNVEDEEPCTIHYILCGVQHILSITRDDDLDELIEELLDDGSDVKLSHFWINKEEERKHLIQQNISRLLKIRTTYRRFTLTNELSPKHEYCSGTILRNCKDDEKKDEKKDIISDPIDPNNIQQNEMQIITNIHGAEKAFVERNILHVLYEIYVFDEKTEKYDKLLFCNDINRVNQPKNMVNLYYALNMDLILITSKTMNESLTNIKPITFAKNPPKIIDDEPVFCTSYKILDRQEATFSEGNVIRENWKNAGETTDTFVSVFSQSGVFGGFGTNAKNELFGIHRARANPSGYSILVNITNSFYASLIGLDEVKVVSHDCNRVSDDENIKNDKIKLFLVKSIGFQYGMKILKYYPDFYMRGGCKTPPKPYYSASDLKQEREDDGYVEDEHDDPNVPKPMDQPHVPQ